jgi:hypothetical protein
MAAILTQNVMKISHMSEARYDLSYKGDLLEGFYADFVKADLKNLFKANDDYIDRLFAGSEQIIKRDVDKATAVKFQQAFKQAGAKLIVRAAGTATNQAAPEPKAAIGPNTQPAQSTLQTNRTESAATGQFSLTSDPLPNEGAASLVEQHQPPLQAPSKVPDWSVAQAGTTLIAAQAEVTPSVIAPAFSVAETGADLLVDKPNEPLAPAIDLSRFDLAEPGADIETLSVPVAPLEIDISHIKLTD